MVNNSLANGSVCLPWLRPACCGSLTVTPPTVSFLVQVTDGDGFVTAEEEEGEDDGGVASEGAAAALGSTVEAAKDMAADMKQKTKSNLDSLKAKAKAELEDATDRAKGDGGGEGDGEEAEEGDLRARLPKGGKVDVSYV